MTTRTQLLSEMDAIEAIAKRLATVAERTDDQRKQDLATARRELAIRMMTVMAIGEDYPPIRQNAAVYAELRKRLSGLRAVIADHQARWSAVVIGSDDQAYSASSAGVQQAGRDFMRWVRRQVESLPPSTDNDDGDAGRRAAAS
ncbi:MAG: hypothetical protein K2X59_11835 [Sphingomonas sp.]|nr:hypothetical protein [Sphingomonas sp.]